MPAIKRIETETGKIPVHWSGSLHGLRDAITDWTQGTLLP